MITFLDSPGGNVMGVQLSGAVAADDYRQLDVRLKHLIDLWGHVGIVVVFEEGATFNLGARWAGTAIRLRHAGHVACLALVGPESLERQIRRRFALRFTQSRFFQVDQLNEAWAWAAQCGKEAAVKAAP